MIPSPQAPPQAVQPAANNMDAWRKHLICETARVARTVKKQVAVLHQDVKKSQPRAHCLGAGCGAHRMKLDMVQFLCNDKHRFCTTCVQKMLAEAAKGERYNRCTDSTMILADLSAACNGQLQIVSCPLCRRPNVIVSIYKFHETFARERMDTRLELTVHRGATAVLDENCYIAVMLENQRRPFFGAFSAANLLVVDFCGAHSIEPTNPNATNATEVREEDLEDTFGRPNRSWAWLDSWSPDLSLSKQNGWRYSKNFDAAWPGEWKTDVSMMTFVRRRRMMRTRVRVNAEVKSSLARFFTATDEQQ